MILTDLQNALLSIDEHTYYGSAAQHPKDEPWDYLVFYRDTLSRRKNKAGYTDCVNVEVTREEFVDDALVEAIVESVEALPGFTLREGEHEYWYGVKPSTHHTVERLVLHFAHARKA